MNFPGLSTGSGAAGVPASLPSGPVNFYNPAYGGVPTVPNPTATAGAAAAGNTSNLPQLETLASGTNVFNQGQLLGQYNMAIPNYAALTATASGNTMQELQGEVPQDVISLLTQQAAERGITTGSPASGNANAAYLRALGLTSVGQQQQGMANLHQLTADAPVAPIFNPASMFVTPDQQQEAQYMANLLASSPSPEAAATAAKSAATVGSSNPNLPWWARGSGMPVALGPGSYLQGNTWHTPA